MTDGNTYAINKHLDERTDMNITLDTDELGIWLIEETPDGPKQMGMVSWKQVTQGVQTALLQEKFLLALARLDEMEGLLDE